MHVLCTVRARVCMCVYIYVCVCVCVCACVCCAETTYTYIRAPTEYTDAAGVCSLFGQELALYSETVGWWHNQTTVGTDSGGYMYVNGTTTSSGKSEANSQQMLKDVVHRGRLKANSFTGKATVLCSRTGVECAPPVLYDLRGSGHVWLF